MRSPEHSAGVAFSLDERLDMERSAAQRVLYHVHLDCLPGNPLQVPEAALIEWMADDG